MKTAVIVERFKDDYEQFAVEYIVFDEGGYSPYYTLGALHPRDRHMTLEAAKNSAYDNGYKQYKYKGKLFTFRQSRQKRKYEADNS